MLTLTIPFRDWPVERVAACAEAFGRVPDTVLKEIIVLDFGSTRPLPDDLSPDPRLRVVRVEAAAWSIAEAINAGALLARQRAVAKVDADVLLAPSSVDGFVAAAERVASGAAALVLAQSIDLPPETSLATAREAIAAGNFPAGALRSKWGQGCLAIFDRAAWAAIGGFDTRFTGWGSEDNDFADRLRRSGRRIEWADRTRLRIFHVAHPPTHAAPQIARQWQRNNELLRSDQSVLRRLEFRHSNALSLAAPNVIARSYPHVTLAIATTARPGRDRMIVEAIQSFRGQIDNDFEIVVVDNGSPPETLAPFRALLDGLDRWPSMRFESLAEPSIPAARNAITAMARGRYTCVVDDDDIALPNRLADHLAVFANEAGIHGSHGGWIDFDEDTGQIERNPGKERRLATLARGRGKITAHPACLYRTDVLRALPYDESLDLGSDLDLALRMAAMGMRIAHTGSFVTLRRFHAANVTITGTGNQLMKGIRARERLWASFSRRCQDELRAQATEPDPDADCRNHLSMDELAHLLPGYVGEWRLALPVDAINGATPADGAGSPTVLEALYKLWGGDMVTERNGPDEPIMLVSDPVRGLERARDLAAEAEALVGRRPAFLSTAQLAADRSESFDWASLLPRDGDVCLLRSPRSEDLAELLVKLRRMEQDSLLRQLLRIVSDHDAGGDCYYLATTPIAHAGNVLEMRATLRHLTGLDFEMLGPGGRVGNPILLGDKVH